MALRTDCTLMRLFEHPSDRGNRIYVQNYPDNNPHLVDTRCRPVVVDFLMFLGPLTTPARNAHLELNPAVDPR